MNDLENEITGMEMTVQVKKEEANALIGELETLRDDVMAFDSLLSGLEKQYAEKEALFLSRVKVMYQYSDYNVIDIFFSSRDFFDFIGRLDTYLKMLNEDKRLLDELKSMQEQVRIKQEQGALLLGEKEELLAEIDAAITEINDNMTISRQNYTLLISVLAELQRREAELNEQSEQLAGEIDDAREEALRTPIPETQRPQSHTAAPTDPPATHTPVPTDPPTAVPSHTPEPTGTPTAEPTAEPTHTPAPTEPPTDPPTAAPTQTAEPTAEPTHTPAPTEPPTDPPTEPPTEPPTAVPTEPQAAEPTGTPGPDGSGDGTQTQDPSGETGSPDEDPRSPEACDFGWPLEMGGYYLTSFFGYRLDPFTGLPSGHSGTDIAMAEGTPIYAVQSGVVITSTTNGNGYGFYIQIQHDNGVRTLYAHCSRLLVEVGDRVSKGDKIALVGSTGNATGPHLHLEVIIDSTRYDALLYLPRDILLDRTYNWSTDAKFNTMLEHLHTAP